MKKIPNDLKANQNQEENMARAELDDGKGKCMHKQEK